MPVEPESLTLAADFPAPSRDDWRELVTAVLAKTGADRGDPEDVLAYETYDGITIKPLYTADDAPDLDADGLPGQVPFVRGAVEDGQGWDVRVRATGPDTAAANTTLLAELETGATSLWLVLGDGGVPVEELAALLEGVYLDLAPIVLDAGAQTRAAADALLALAGDTTITGNLGADPIGAHARFGVAAELEVLGELAGRVRDRSGLRVATVDATIYHDAGAGDAQELGIATAVGVAYLRALTGSGLSVDDALDTIEFRFAVTAEQFPSIAKLRAARRIWDRVAVLCEASDGRPGQRQHAVTSAAMLTRRDPWVNILRSTIGCFAAAVGGAGAITVLPFDAAIGASDDFARRIARNTQAVLHDESSLARVIDAAGGSWFVESLTDSLAEAAWTVFTDIERNGGVLARLDDGTVEKFLSSTRAKRADDIAHRRAPITGVSEYAFVDEKPVTRTPLAPVESDGLLPHVRWAQDFESLRDRSDAAEERPTVFIVPMGLTTKPTAADTSSPQIAFVQNLFNAGGIRTEVTAADDFAGGVVCLTGAKRQYADEGSLYVRDLRARGAALVWAAGKDADVDEDGCLYLGCDALAALRRTLDTLGVDA